jgi:pimeloyl-ACP methyl ester carboxylesterase
MPFVELPSSPLAPGATPVRIRYRDFGRGAPLVFLHGGWGYEAYPFDQQIAALASTCRIIIPDRSGYGGSTSIERLDLDFHQRAAEETRAVIDALGLERPILWGHSDGAVVATLVALADPDRVRGAILEATHFAGRKPASRAFFESMAANPDSVGDRLAAVLLRDHGDHWRDVIRRHSSAWLRLGDARQEGDFYGGRLFELRSAAVIHGVRDPRTEPGELAAIRSALAQAEFLVRSDGAHSPHSESATADAVTRFASRLVSTWRQSPKA